jgi:hypothetical protein
MASTLLQASAAILATRTTLLTATAAKQTIVITGTVSNVDTANKATHFVTIEVQTGGTYRVLLKDAPVPYGGSLILPKIVMEAADVLHLTGSLVSVLEGYISYVEKD